MLRRPLLSVLVTLFLLSTAAAAEILRINGSTTVNAVVVEAAEILRTRKGMQIEVISRPVTDEDQAKYPKVQFHPTVIGEDAVAIIVSRDVWEGGVKALS